MKLRVVILAAGKGTRMRSDLPKVLHKVANKPMVEHVIDTARSLKPEAINLIYGHGGEQLQKTIQGEDLTWVEQREQLGTGHAVQQVIPYLKDDEKVVILYGDVPLLTESTLIKLLTATQTTELGLLTMTLDDPNGYGRIVRNTDKQVTGIVEQKDANAGQLAIQEVNTGIMIADGAKLKAWLENLSNDNAQKEYYLTDIVAMAAEQGVTIATAQPDATYEVEGANNRQQLAQLERAFQRRQADELMTQGVTLIDPARFDCRGKLTVGNDVTFDINVVIEGDVTIGNNVTVEPNCVIKDATIGDNTVIRANSHIEGAAVAKNCKVGPFARLRPGAELADEAQVGNFVEMKKSRLGKGSKASHLTYLGDAQVGEYANIGAGTITCNYDGVNKFLTEIGDGAFIGSNSSLVAPVKIGNNATVGAGSVVTREVADEELAVARGKQRNISGWQRPQKKGS
ncbi:bifunctional N-acetylglucosamine-1-phosphate uridyltransferase/glucosamine-1-phosphate acetyltransferase [Idiomarina sp. WRN-38]|mgnify:CR=1 FL=1|uniref:bifunctional UDP-N-acetylglucosamine diphosphorylase/glucosamine-1-phosphate N-acetyltransferase GlmU n=1 Tax=Idiomarina sp. OXR-189 TaxID=3100175 RepID=UPI000733598C|nr:bifunctional UDP-N-acetylglucosamine diphosphorylase/glucosamine-1-phosphate N-acetyltransferase GlmU [Idiomarina sp. OXR-189]KTG28714.1 bifunctional N-acetylglucosamine-1-phosphate uridyltransferase/glucosamine-1-phosphate acetyltransferase [Idiomarina sp. H105]OAF09479.1 bifunctional N-acetylglucosamine-1-phosphate uridyltransferase/glucosamine-1-phosphate acetyltransferase [Idiomarina sp. WRN-38]WPZ01350.1 bifunctional UDP-N-acetylglucosamine diphosphorylase/glucosamine-1-phosphate N-acety